MKIKPTLVESLDWYNTLSNEQKKSTTRMFLEDISLWYDLSEGEIHLLYTRVLSYDLH